MSLNLQFPDTPVLLPKKQAQYFVTCIRNNVKKTSTKIFAVHQKILGVEITPPFH